MIKAYLYTPHMTWRDLNSWEARNGDIRVQFHVLIRIRLCVVEKKREGGRKERCVWIYKLAYGDPGHPGFAATLIRSAIHRKLVIY
jgi:hypothetical protein